MVLCFNQNVIERLENATEIKKIKEKIKNHIKDNMGQIVLNLINFLKYFCYRTMISLNED